MTQNVESSASLCSLYCIGLYVDDSVSQRRRYKVSTSCPEAFKFHRVKVILLFSQSSLLSYFVSWLLG